MIRSVSVTNFRCLKSMVVHVCPLTVLIGKNDTGKSAFLDAIHKVGNPNTLHPKDQFAISDYFNMADNNQPVIRCETDSGDAVLSPSNRDEVQEIKPTTIFRLPAQGVAMESEGYPDEKGPPPLGEAGGGVSSLLDYLLRRDRERFFGVVKSMCERVNGLKGIEIATPEPAKRRVDFVVEKGLRIRADQSSSGVRLLLFFVALAHHPDPPKVILVEEPETGLHPKRLADVVSLLREITQGKLSGHAAQVILTTHSPYLLDSIHLETDQVLVFRRNDDGSRGAEAVDAVRLKVFLDEFKLGEVWFNEDEEGLVRQRS